MSGPVESQDPDHTAGESTAASKAHGSREVVFVHEPQTGQVLQVSPSVAEVFGVPTEQVLADPSAWTWRIHPDDRPRVLEALEQLHGGGPYNQEYRVVGTDRETTWIHDHAVPLRGQVPCNGHLRVARDFSRARALEDQLLLAQRMESAALLARGVSHDYNNLLMGLVGCANLALKAVPANSGARPWLDEIKTAALEGARLARSLVLFAAGGEATTSPVELGDAVRQASKLLRTLLGEEIILRTELGEQPLVVTASFSRLQQVLLNLGMNARDAISGSGEVVVRTGRDQVLVDGSLPAGDYGLLSIEDSGTGMSDDVRRRAMEPFFSGRENGDSTGLGLTTVDAIIRRAGGDVRVVSAPGAGTTVTIRLPLFEEEGEPSLPPCKEPCCLATILVVEDNAMVRRTLRGQLESGGHTVLEASDPEDALTLFGEHRDAIQIVVCDVMLQGATGGQVAQAIEMVSPGTPILFVSGHRRDALSDSGSLPPGAPLLQKPLSEAKLLSAVGRLLDTTDCVRNQG